MKNIHVFQVFLPNLEKHLHNAGIPGRKWAGSRPWGYSRRDRPAPRARLSTALFTKKKVAHCDVTNKPLCGVNGEKCRELKCCVYVAIVIGFSRKSVKKIHDGLYSVGKGSSKSWLRPNGCVLAGFLKKVFFFNRASLDTGWRFSEKSFLV